MTVYVVNYYYNDDVDTINAIRPEHRAWQATKVESGDMLASGPFYTEPLSALLIWRSESIEDLSALLDQDPFQIAGVVKETTIKEWNVIFGPFAGK